MKNRYEEELDKVDYLTELNKRKRAAKKEMREKKNKVSVSVSVVFSIEKSIWFKRTNM
jgi:hypothetical protein